jgi:small subunit ribosomal protein S16
VFVAVKIRLMRMGKKKQPTYRVVVADARSPRDGRFIEILGSYAPREEPSRFTIDEERALHWLRVGARPTEQVSKLLDASGVYDRFEAAEGRVPAAKVTIHAPKAKAAAPEVAATASAAPAAAGEPAPPEDAGAEQGAADSGAEAGEEQQ